MGSLRVGMYCISGVLGAACVLACRDGGSVFSSTFLLPEGDEGSRLSDLGHFVKGFVYCLYAN